MTLDSQLFGTFNAQPRIVGRDLHTHQADNPRFTRTVLTNPSAPIGGDRFTIQKSRLAKMRRQLSVLSRASYIVVICDGSSSLHNMGWKLA
jgi:hypothetical protein